MPPDPIGDRRLALVFLTLGTLRLWIGLPEKDWLEITTGVICLSASAWLYRRS